VLFPTLGHLAEGGKHWVLDVHGDVSAPARMTLRKRLLLRLLRRAMQASSDDFAGEIFRERIARFIAGDRGGRRVVVRIGDELHVLKKKTGRSGHFHASLRLSLRQAEEWAESAVASRERYVPTEVEGTLATGRVYLVPPTGLSIISDIDDTLKHSYVSCKRTLLTNTFLKPFEAIAGMAPLFREWWAAGAMFHYVSSSPWQLYEQLAEHLGATGFPTGSFHLRQFRLRDHLLRRLLLLRRSGKLAVIRRIVRRFPERRFLLVGDSGEHDPEIYGAIARRYPHQVAGVLIRQLDPEREHVRRYARAFRGVDPERVKLYECASELKRLTFHIAHSA
jgi:phosphatidate phosphatase APP1